MLENDTGEYLCIYVGGLHREPVKKSIYCMLKN